MQMVTDFFCLNKKFLVYNMVSRNIRSKYGRSVFGLGWTLLSPLMFAGMYYFVFKKVMHMQMERYLAFTLSGVLPWAFFSQCLMEGMDSIVGNEGLISKIPIPLQTLPFVNSSTNFITLSASIPVLLIVSAYQGVTPGLPFLFVLYFFSCLFLMAYSASLFLSVAYVLFRDLRHVMGLFVQLWMFATPVLYSVEMLPPPLQKYSHFNPVSDLFSGLHRIFTQGATPTPTELFFSLAWTLLFALSGMVFIQTKLRNIVEKL